MTNENLKYLGPIKKDWSWSRIKYITAVPVQTGAGEEALDYFENSIRYIRISDFNSNGKIDEDKAAYIDRNIGLKFLIKKNDILAATAGATVGKSLLYEGLNEDACYAGYLAKIRTDLYKMDSRFLFYQMVSKLMDDFRECAIKKSTIENISASSYSNMYIHVTDIENQKRIADYLDKKVSAIDSLIEKEEKAVEELKEYSLSLIEKVTTHGLTKEPLHKTLCKWIDGVPEKWIVSKSIYVLSMPITDGPHETLNLIEDGIPFISAEAIKNNKIDFDLRRGNISDNDYRMCCQKYIPKLNDVYMIKSGATTGNVAMVEDNRIFTIWSPLAVYRANTKKILPRFVFYALRSKYYKNQVEDGWSFGTQQNIGMRVLEKLYIAYPVSLKEQQEIVDYLDKKCESIDKLLELKEEKIEKLKEYKKSLIYECVTGRRQINA